MTKSSPKTHSMSRMAVKVKRESWNHKYHSVARDPRGQFVATMRWKGAVSTRETEQWAAARRISVRPTISFPPAKVRIGRDYSRKPTIKVEEFPYRYVVGINKIRGTKDKYELYMPFNSAHPRDYNRARLGKFLSDSMPDYGVDLRNFRVLGVYSRLYGGDVNPQGIPYKHLRD